MTKTRTPQPVSGIDIAFGGNMKALLPPMSEIPEEFHDWNNKWGKVFSDFFFAGAKNIKRVPKEGIDGDMAWANIRAVMGSFEPKHEHKEAACAYLLSLWFKSISYDSAGKHVEISHER